MYCVTLYGKFYYVLSVIVLPVLSTFNDVKLSNISLIASETFEFAYTVIPKFTANLTHYKLNWLDILLLKALGATP